jgi:DNA adenine methylase
MLHFLATHLPKSSAIKGRFIEPFVGGGAIYFYVQPYGATLSDVNAELIEIYSGVRRSPQRVWDIYRNYPGTKRAYKHVRDVEIERLTPLQRAARSLFLSRTCFKGMWRHNLKGKFNVGYGGQSRRWAVSRADLFSISTLLRTATLKCSDFEPIIAAAKPGDFLFADPPYRPGEKEQVHDHYSAKRFRFGDHKRLASSLREADKRGVEWLLTTSSHPAIVRLFGGFTTIPIQNGTGREIGSRNNDSGEMLITNCPRATQ